MHITEYRGGWKRSLLTTRMEDYVGRFWQRIPPRSTRWIGWPILSYLIVGFSRRDKFYEFGHPPPPPPPSRSCYPPPKRLLHRVITLHQAGVTQDKYVEGEGGTDK